MMEQECKARSEIFVGSPSGNYKDEVWGSGAEAWPVSSAPLGLGLFLGTVTMLFAGFTSAYMVHRATPAWQPIPLPPTLWLNTVLLLLSSVTIEVARAAFKRGRGLALKRWLLITACIGVAFLVGQLATWRQLVQAGVYLPSHPHSSFFYILTGAHGLHLLSGLGALFYVLGRAWSQPAPPLRDGLTLCTVYWHFLDALWLYLFFMFLTM